MSTSPSSLDLFGVEPFILCFLPPMSFFLFRLILVGLGKIKGGYGAVWVLDLVLSAGVLLLVGFMNEEAKVKHCRIGCRFGR